MKTIKVVLHCQASDGSEDKRYGKDGFFHQKFEEQLGKPINFYGFEGLEG